MYHLQVFDGFLELQLGPSELAGPCNKRRTPTASWRKDGCAREPVLGAGSKPPQHMEIREDHGGSLDHWIIPHVIQNWKRIMKSPSRVVKHWQTQLANFICVSNGIYQPAALQSVLKYLTILQGSRPH